MRPLAHARAGRLAGFSLVELMVGMVIGLIAVVVMFQIFAVSEGSRRTTTGAGDAQQNGVTSLYLIERDARMAGYGFNYMPLLGCNVTGTHNPTGQPVSFRLTPLLINNGAAGAPDAVTFMYGTGETFAMPGAVSEHNNAAGRFKVKDPRFQFKMGDLVVAASAGLPCSLFQVTGLPTPPDGDQIRYGAPSYVDEQGNTHASVYSPFGPLPVTYPVWNPNAGVMGTGGRLFNLGQTPAAITYAIQNSQLVAADSFRPAEQVVVSDGIVQMQAQYGYSADCPPGGAYPQTRPCRIDPGAASVPTINVTVANDQWGDAMPAGATGNDWRKVIAVRMAIVARSMTPERPDPDGVCRTTTASPVWDTTGATLDVTQWDPANWSCYRYRVFEMVAPMRNMMWFSEPTGSTIPPVE